MNTIAQRRVARAIRPGGPDVIEVTTERIAELEPGQALVRVEAAALNHADTLIRSGTYVLRLPFPYAVGVEGAGTIEAIRSRSPTLTVGTRVCWTGVFGSCATSVVAPAALLTPIPAELSLEDGACLAHSGATAGALARVWPLEGATVVVWGAAGVLGRLLVAVLASRGARVIGIASGERLQAVRDAGAIRAVDRTSENVQAVVREITGDRGVTAVFDPVANDTFSTSLSLLAPRGCLINYGELSGPVSALNLHQLFEAGGVFVTKFNGKAYVNGAADAVSLIASALELAATRRTIISDIAGRFPLDETVSAFRALESTPRGKILITPHA